MRRIRVQSRLAAVFFLAAALTAVWPNWIELLGLGDPDRGNGYAEWAVVAGFAAAAAVSGLLATRNHQRLRALHTEA